MKNKYKNLLLIFLFVFLFTTLSFAQYTIEKTSVFGNGGGIISSSNKSINGSVAQTFMGTSVNTNSELYSGFWM